MAGFKPLGVSTTDVLSSPLLLRGLITIAVVALYFKTDPAHAMSPPYNPWFGEVFSADARDLPSGVEVAQSPVERVGDVGLEIRNYSDTPLYLRWPGGSPRLDMPPELVEVQVSPGAATWRKVDLGQAFQWQTLRCMPEACAGYWAFTGTSIKLAPSSLRHFAVGLQQRNMRGGGAAGSARPADVEVPPREDAELRLLYGERPLVVPLTLTYVLNSAYEEIRAGWEEGQQNLSKLAAVVMIAGLIAVVGFAAMFGWVIVWMVRELYGWWRRLFA
jgi:hypothetical protein